MLTDVQTPFLGTPLVPLQIKRRLGSFLGPLKSSRRVEFRGTRGTLVGLPGYIPHASAVQNSSPMVRVYREVCMYIYIYI